MSKRLLSFRVRYEQLAPLSLRRSGARLCRDDRARWALSVVFAEYPLDYVLESEAHLPGHVWLWPLYDYKSLAVQFFWLISGFVFMITYGHQGRSINARQFFAHRFARLYPLHFVTLIFVAVVQFIALQKLGSWQVYGNNDASHFIAQLFMASNWLNAKDASFNAPIWSVSVEVLVYGLFVLVLYRFGSGIVRMALAATMLFVVERFTYSLLAWCGALFFIGVLIAQLEPMLRARVGNRTTIAVAAAGVASSSLVIWFIAAAGFGGHEASLLAYFFMPAVLLMLAALDVGTRPLHRSFHWIGAITYSVYLLHMPLIITLKTLMPAIFADRDILRSGWTLAAYVVAVVMLSILSHRYFELPTQRWLRSRLSPRKAGIENGSPDNYGSPVEGSTMTETTPPSR